MLKAGAARVFFAKVTYCSLVAAFEEIMKLVPAGTPVVCESPALRRFAEPGLFIIMTSSVKDNQKDIKLLTNLPHVKSDLDCLSRNESLPVYFNNGRWTS